LFLFPTCTLFIFVNSYEYNLSIFFLLFRYKVAKQLSDKVKANKVKIRTAKVLDMCCGVGVSTRALQDAFPDSEFVFGVDTSPEMINMAGFLTDHVDFFKPLIMFFTKNSNKMMTLKRIANPGKTKFPKKRAKFTYGNAEKTNFPSKSFDLVTIMYAFHEAPKVGREKILKEAYRVLQPGGTLAVIDISTDYQPSKGMLAGEPYGKYNYIYSRLASMSARCYIVNGSKSHTYLFACSFLFSFLPSIVTQSSSTRRTFIAKCALSEAFQTFDTKL
jgi:ubiquinone/menaquinone biosynthesis C-methylase UbiE